MNGENFHAATGKVMLALASLAVVTVGIGALLPPPPPRADEGALARIFQLSIVALAPTILMFVVTADWRRPGRSVRWLVITGALVTVAFGALYWLEHVR